MHTAVPAYSDICVLSGVKSEPIEPPPEPTYAQSKQSENSPRPSLPAAPPKMRVNQALFRSARQKIDTPVKVLATTRQRKRLLVHGEDVRRDVLGDPLPHEYHDTPVAISACPFALRTQKATHKIQKKRIRFFCNTADLPRWSVSKSWTVGMSCG